MASATKPLCSILLLAAAWATLAPAMLHAQVNGRWLSGAKGGFVVFIVWNGQNKLDVSCKDSMSGPADLAGIFADPAETSRSASIEFDFGQTSLRFPLRRVDYATFIDTDCPTCKVTAQRLWERLASEDSVTVRTLEKEIRYTLNDPEGLLPARLCDKATLGRSPTASRPPPDRSTAPSPDKAWLVGGWAETASNPHACETDTGWKFEADGTYSTFGEIGRWTLDSRTIALTLTETYDEDGITGQYRNEPPELWQIVDFDSDSMTLDTESAGRIKLGRCPQY